MTRVKICGITEPGAAEVASEAGASALGLMFYEPSPRAVDIRAARDVIAATDPLVTMVGVFVDAQREWVEQVLEHCPLDCLQFHGHEDRAFCESFGRPYLRVISMRPEVDVAQEVAAHPRARGYLLDAWRADAPGGTGETFSWDRIPPLASPWILAGGLTAANVGDAIRRTRPGAVDVSGGVEEQRGVKSPQRIREFMDAVKRADSGEEA